MIGYWHSVPLPDSQAQIALGTHLGGHDLIVERCRGDRSWHWMVLNAYGHEIESGEAPDAHMAEQQAEEAAYHIHPPSVGDWVARLLG